MMASYLLFVVCAVLCTVHAVHSYSIRGSIVHNNGAVSEVQVSSYIDGVNWGNAQQLTLNRLEGAETLATLTLTNFKSVQLLNLSNIALEQVPVFENTSCYAMMITQNKIKSVPAYAFRGPGPVYLDLSTNGIQSMADRSVNAEARAVILNCNKLGHFSATWFEEPGNIKVLSVVGNRIEYIQDRAFNQMTKLHWLELGYNHIASIGGEAFNTGLTNLYLQFNDIAQLTGDMFAHRYTPMSDLLLHHNQLSYLSEALLVKLRPRVISLVGNPWQCQCLRDVERWLRELNSTLEDLPSRRDEPGCVVPLSFQNVCVPVIDKEMQQTYARGLSPVPQCLATPCQCALRFLFANYTRLMSFINVLVNIK